MARKETERELCSEAEVDLQTAQLISYEKVETWLMSYSNGSYVWNIYNPNSPTFRSLQELCIW
ncbi:hypothetical protein ACQKP0_22190 [Heyndrickxia sp. NPDC080065]|uniref:hypothetical protein n=1 Tax=Heyndrickxia sp. NPDC080065 TaxID=3390568 RepID=UPI003D04EF34